jgi:predicted lactoylglutathione lyase
MAQIIFVNLPVTDLPRAKAFYAAIGFRNEPKFSNEHAAMMQLSDSIAVMLLTHDFYSTFTQRPIAPPHGTSQVLLCLSADSKAEVDKMTEAARAAGGKTDVSQEDQTGEGPMYGRDFEDLDGHQWSVMWMDPAFAEQGAHPAETVEA